MQNNTASLSHCYVSEIKQLKTIEKGLEHASSFLLKTLLQLQAPGSNKEK